MLSNEHNSIANRKYVMHVILVKVTVAIILQLPCLSYNWKTFWRFSILLYKGFLFYFFILSKGGMCVHTKFLVMLSMQVKYLIFFMLCQSKNVNIHIYKKNTEIFQFILYWKNINLSSFLRRILLTVSRVSCNLMLSYLT